MKTTNETYFGNRQTFAIRYVPGYTDVSKKYFYAYCHLVLGGQLIGNPEEPCYLNSWKYSFEGLKDRIKNNFSSITHTEFSNRSDREIVELIWKANQFEEEYKPEFSHLPALDSEVWRHCHVSIDETTDAFSIAMIEQNGQLKFLWEGWRAPCDADRIGKLYSIVVDRQFVIESMKACLQTIEKEYLNYPVNG